jgi:hypothetical protein
MKEELLRIRSFRRIDGTQFYVKEANYSHHSVALLIVEKNYNFYIKMKGTLLYIYASMETLSVFMIQEIKVHKFLIIY